MSIISVYNKWITLSAGVLAVLSAMVSCDSHNVPIKSIPEIIIADNMERIPLEKFDSLFNFSRYIIPQLTDKSILDKINKVYFFDDKLYVMHGNSTISMFDSIGRFVRNYSYIGQGPGEYISAEDFDINENAIFILSRNKIYKYNLNGDFINVVELDNAAQSLCLLSEGIALNNGFGYGSKITKSNNSYSYVGKGPTVNAIEFNKTLLGNSFVNNNLVGKFFSDGKTNFTYFPFNDTIYRIVSSNGRIAPLVSLKIGNRKRNINKETSVEEVRRIKNSGVAKSIYSTYKFGDKILFSYSSDGRPKIALISLDGDVLMNGCQGDDSRGLPVFLSDLHSNKNYDEVLSIVPSSLLKDIASDKENLTDYPILKRISQSITEEGNPVFVFYKIKF